MAIRNILKDGDETLRKKSKSVVDFDDRLNELIDDMFETTKKNMGAGLSAVQVGILKRVFVMDAGGGKKECINPEILKISKKTCTSVEGCLSVPGKCGDVERPVKITVKFQDRKQRWHTEEMFDFEAKCFCHEFDHLDGILYTDRAVQMYDDRDEYNRKKKKK